MKRGTPRHPKTRALAKKLNITIQTAVGILEMLWHFADEFCPRGDIGRLENQVIAESIEWSGDPEALIEALVDVHWLDECADPDRIVIHEWHEHCTDYNKKRIKSLGVSFASEQKILENSRKVSPPARACPAPPNPAPPQQPADLEVMPEPWIYHEAGGREPNPEYRRVQDALRGARKRIEAADNPVAYSRAVVRSAKAGS